MVAEELEKIAVWVALTNSQQSPGKNTEKQLPEHFDWGRSKVKLCVSKISLLAVRMGKDFRFLMWSCSNGDALRVAKMVRWEQSSRAGAMQALYSLLSAELSARCLGCLSVLFRTVILALGRWRQDKFKGTLCCTASSRPA